MLHKMTHLAWLLLSLAVIGADQFSKYTLTTHLVLGEIRPLSAHVNLVLAHNYGAAFSLLNRAAGWQRWPLVGVSALIIVAMLGWLGSLDGKRPTLACGLALVIGGAVGNVIDRVATGYVVDFLDVFIKTYHWPTFNIADSALCLGVGLIVLSLGKRPL